MTRIVGQQQRSDFVLDPAEALRRGRVLDRMLSSAAQLPPRGVMRAPHRRFNELDDRRCLQVAQRLNAR